MLDSYDRGTHWQGAADFLVEIISPGERTHDKIPFYGSIGVVELLIVNRDPWTLKLSPPRRWPIGKSRPIDARSPAVLESRTVAFRSDLFPAKRNRRSR